MEHLRYDAGEPYPERDTLTEVLYSNHYPAAYSEGDATRYTSSKKRVLAPSWSVLKVDFYAVEPDFVIIEWLSRNSVTSAGPFILRRQNSRWIELEDTSGRIFSHWKWIVRINRGVRQYRSTLLALWSESCACKKAESNKQLSSYLPLHCLCDTILLRDRCYVCCSKEAVCRKKLTSTTVRIDDRTNIIAATQQAVAVDTIEKTVLPDTQQKKDSNEAELSEENKDQLIEETLSQDICLCSSLFKDDGICYCGYKTNKSTRNEGSSKTNTEGRITSKNDLPPAAATPVPADLNGMRKKGPTKVAAPRKPPAKKAETKVFQVSVTIGIIGQDISLRTFEDLKRFADRRASIAVASLERGDATLCLHIQSVMVLESTSTWAIKVEISQQLGWASHCPVGGAICIKALTNKGLHTLPGMIGYCIKDEKELHYQLYSKNVTEAQFEEGRRRYLILGACDYKNQVELTPYNILARAMQFRKHRVSNPIGISMRGCIRQMMLSGHYYPSLRWLFSLTVSRIRAETLWRLATQPESTKPVDVDEVYFGFRPPKRYFYQPDESFHHTRVFPDPDQGRMPPEDCGSQHGGEQHPLDPPTPRTDRHQKQNSSADTGHDNEDCPEFISLFRELTSGSMQEWMIPDTVGDMDDLDALKSMFIPIPSSNFQFANAGGCCSATPNRSLSPRCINSALRRNLRVERSGFGH
ncbi:hypothetical protein R1sor_005242 [Riccia sorocarpa]|uniref:Replitron HUH endonuclease domain-containing protein n=1 Tax=Riccia sorocarpa TaxID=122646 RepID=A0ABD3HKY6_9MARC